MDRSDGCWLLAGLIGIVLTWFLDIVFPEPPQQPASVGSGLFSPDEPVVDPLDHGEAMRRNKQQSGI